MKSALIPGNHSSFEILELFDIWRYQSLVILFFSSAVMNQIVFVLYSGIIQFLTEHDLTLTRLSAIISPYFDKFIKHNKSNTAFLHDIVIIFPSIYL